MTKMLILFLISIALALSGCGYKGSPYYEKSPAEGTGHVL
ncbi:MAG: LPS translocon maturation chaperone LptM [Sulfuricurvum sp.]